MLSATKYLKEKSSGKATYEAKRKRVEEIVKNTTEIEDAELDTQLTLYVKSSDGKKKYAVNIGYQENNIHFECSCGEQFGLKAKRNSCCHIGTAVMKMNKAFMDNILQNGKGKVVDSEVLSQIVTLLEKFEI